MDAIVAAVNGESLFEEMKRYVRFGPGDVLALADLHPHAAPHFERIAEEFYERIREHEGAHNVFTGEEQVERLKRSLVRWMHRVCTGPYDEAYFEETSKIGRIHVGIGLPQRYMFTAMALIRVALERIADDTMKERAHAAREAVCRALDLELAIMVDAYRTDHEARIHRINQLERERAGRTLAATERRYMQAVELARVIVVGLDASGHIRLFNREAERVTELARHEVIGASFVDVLLPEALREEHGRVIQAAARERSAEALESAVRTKSGKIREVEWQLAHAPSEDDAEVALFAIGHDTTDQRALARRVRQSEKLAAVGTLAAGLAHEIRNPLNGAALHLTFLERGLKRSGAADGEMMEAVKVVSDEIKRLGALVSEFLDFARPNPLSKRPVSIRALCERTVQMVAPDAASANVEVKTDLPVSDLELELDPGKMEQVLLNLLKNAIEAQTPMGQGKVTLRVRRQPRQEVIEVEDEGPGLTDPHAPIFDPFFSTKPNGTGLGLAIAHRIVTDHDGSIDAHSGPGKTIFRITLPIRLAG